MNNKIFVQIASYRDPELIPTIKDCITKAKHPENLTFGICWQYGDDENLTDLDNLKNECRIEKFHFSESEGLGWARNITNKLYRGEDYTLQLDSHHRFQNEWDRIVLDDYNQASSLSKKPIISTYCTPWDVQNNVFNPMPCLMSQYEFSHDKLLMSRPWYIQNYKSRKVVIKARTLSGHFYFVDGGFIKEVPYDSDIYFGGYTEETTLSVRAFTHGYDFYSPYRQVMWHEYTRNYRKKHWEDHGIESKTKKTSGERDIYARNKTRQMFGQEFHNIDMGIYGLGTKRTLHDYEVYGGFDFKKCRIQDYTLNVNEPPNPPDWEDQFISRKYTKSIRWDVEFFKKQQFKKPKFLTFGLVSRAGNEVYRKDFTVESDPAYLNFTQNEHTAIFNSEDAPYKVIMYLFDEEKQWSQRYEREI